MSSFLDAAKQQMEQVLTHLREGIGVLRTGRATPALVENIAVEAYGTTQPLKALASMSTPDARTLAIEPWDASVTQAIERAIQQSEIGIQPVVDGKTIRLTMPSMTEEMRQRLVKTLREKMEDSRVAVRHAREDARKQIGNQEGISEDVIKREQEALDKLAKEYVAKIEEVGEKKEEEIMKV